MVCLPFATFSLNPHCTCMLLWLQIWQIFSGAFRCFSCKIIPWQYLKHQNSFVSFHLGWSRSSHNLITELSWWWTPNWITQDPKDYPGSTYLWWSKHEHMCNASSWASRLWREDQKTVPDRGPPTYGEVSMCKAIFRASGSKRLSLNNLKL